MLKTIAEKLIKISVIGEIASPKLRNVYNFSATGKPLGSAWSNHLMTSSDGKIIPQINSKANIASLLKLRANI